MKQTILILAAILCFSCSKDNTSNITGGRVVFNAAVESSVTAQTKASSTTELPAELIPNIKDFTLDVTGSYTDPETDEVKGYSFSYSSIYEQNEMSPFMTKGNYNGAIELGEKDIEGEGKAYFSGDADFAITARNVTECTINAKLSNSVIKLTTTEWFNKYYTSATFIVTTTLKNEYTYKIGEEMPLIFVNAGTTLTLSGTAIKTNGFTVEFPAKEIGTTKEQTLYNIVIDASEAGESGIKINFDDTVIDVPIDVELNPEV